MVAAPKPRSLLSAPISVMSTVSSSPDRTAQGEGEEMDVCRLWHRANKERSAVRGKGGGYVCLEGCGLMEGRRERKGKRPLEAGS